MTYRPSEFSVSMEDPFANDALDRHSLVAVLAGVIWRTKGPFVIALDGPWGSGKSTMLQMLRSLLQKHLVETVQFNAWEADFGNDPLVALSAAIEELPGASKKTAEVKKAVSIVAKRLAYAGMKTATLGILDVEKEFEAAAAEFAKDSTKDLVDEFIKEKGNLKKLRVALTNAIPQLAGEAGKSLVFLIDEIDRCRPTYALELLERVKHIFHVDRLIFVIAVDKPQLEAIIQSVYGTRFDAAEYLRRFFDLEVKLPPPGGLRFAESLSKRFQLPALFEARPHLTTGGKNLDVFIFHFAHLSRILDLSLRAQERCFTRLRLLLDQTEDGRFFPGLTALLIVLRTKEPALYTQIAAEDLDFVKIEDLFCNTMRGTSYFLGIEGQYLCAELLRGLEDTYRARRVLAQVYGGEKPEPLASKLTSEWWSGVAGYIEGRLDGRSKPSIRSIVQKLDFMDAFR